MSAQYEQSMINMEPMYEAFYTHSTVRNAEET
jgi:hypothetical protein